MIRAKREAQQAGLTVVVEMCVKTRCSPYHLALMTGAQEWSDENAQKTSFQGVSVG
ncbi:hypothetical protein AA0312_2645 [Acetobacter tropicalis NRIC 0312]|uniref:Uncharacterized protein n=1 Tax=Acetobacter tropicalis TaxID=104102 RepID=A0A511FQ51_9PROT|nr:hypothetical protein AA0312_2645 [Acetobacter tropicalis NRIC 0312]GEL51069.1 hypothetical protein ATR01nite_21440 [Acetobacter tropicalis]